jgi:hypothetical protein
MASEIIVGTFALVGSIVGALATIVSTTIVTNRTNLIKRHLELARQVEAYHKLEELYKNTVASLQGRPADTIMKEMRDKVENAGGYARPKMTQTEARGIIEKWS